MWTAYDAKLVGVALISCGTFATGLLPAWFGLGTRWRRPSTTLSSILCFGGGVLLATSLVHILPESREALGPWAEIVLCSGYFMLYLVDVLLQFINNPKTDSQLAEGENLIRNQSCRSYESIERSEPSVSFKQQQHIVDNYIAEGQVTTANVGMLVAFSVHSLLEGLVIGVQSTPTEVMLLVGAVSCHKLVVAFCLGAELSSDGRPLYSVIPPIFVYVLGSALGILAGMFLHLGTNPEGNMVVPVFQAIAGGTLLYIVLSEILPRERSKSLPGYAPFVQFLLFIIGFVLMVLLNFYV